ncbi:MAG: hypothetical protein RLN62_06305 [Rickettsiales bacterium]
MSANETIIKQQDFGRWVNVDLYMDAIRNKCKGKLGHAEITTLSNMFAIIFALKARDFVNYKSDQSPGDIKSDAQRCADNLHSYLQNYPTIKKDWLELFVIGYSGESIMLQNVERTQDILQTRSDNLEDDNYALNAALFVSTLDDRLNEKQQEQITKAIIKRTTLRKEIVQKRMGQKVKGKKRFRNLFSKKAPVKSAKKPRVVMIEYIFQGILSGVTLIVGAKLFPAFGMMSALSGGVVGYLSSGPLFRSASKVHESLSGYYIMAKYRFSKEKPQYGRTTLRQEELMPISNDGVEISDEIRSLKQSISQTVAKQKSTMARYSAAAKKPTSVAGKREVEMLQDDSHNEGNLTVDDLENVHLAKKSYEIETNLRISGIEEASISKVKVDRSLPNVIKKDKSLKV